MFRNCRSARGVPDGANDANGVASTVARQRHPFNLLIKGLAIMASVAAAHAFAQSPSPAMPRDGVYDMIVGTYTGGKSEGLYVYRFDTRTGDATPVSVAKTVNPSWLVVSRDNRHVYAVNELPGDNGPATQRGNVSAFRFDPQAGQLTFVNQVSAQGNDPCYLSLSPDGRYLFVANYSVAADPGGSFAALPIRQDGSLGDAALTAHHEGSGPVKGRQDGAHVHSTVFSPDGRYLFAQDLGTDRLYAYRYAPDGDNGPVSPTDAVETALKAGSGPRHLLFSGDGRHAYLTSELAATVTVFRYRDGKLAEEQVEPLAEPGFKGAVGGSALHLSPDGRFLYVSNRGDANDISIFAVDADSGRLKRVGRQSSLGKSPREFAIDPTGRWLIVGNQNSDTAYVFRRDPQTGLLGTDPKRIDIGSPVDFKFVSPS
ncbi:lactonase family protein [Paraburkholderia caballeronis]|uniref:6-phosphogluconolactonase, cycloisomerase 2 family n=1 Tax=Paraburkholderia caballeronis TaxID=416943 RepID=A0A1H7T6H9_9BURK|nr:6-phosphogluconolactonase (cycloisomerase 2 family) [Paraburkholderia caballeronis]PXW96816.1 6-phosphogluconolactonase (cycloisomerase 2 family) [Paraburkholderia caballeronis]RAJ93443.1 6-phosphogluconolactonase (cycloisomerase 2 family) [Paraburkholderia caballeronis]SEC72161.1 6-phosphogluconolactonase, cycloisomerase 2 family [Paraburkholderia caballeronis]SEL80125.1 6-phosphogluconolactonase, cycloisomerase 2 family [Paraburkholderia caballeronis]